MERKNSKAKDVTANTIQYLESQASYLRYLATCCASSLKDQPSSNSSSNPQNFKIKQTSPPERKQNPYDDIPVQSLNVPFETFIEKQLPKPANVKRQDQTKHSYLKRKSEMKIKQNKDTQSFLKTQSKWTGALNSVEESLEELECDEKTKEDVIHFPISKNRKSLTSKNLIKPKEKLKPKVSCHDKKQFLKRGEGKLCFSEKNRKPDRLSFEKNTSPRSPKSPVSQLTSSFSKSPSPPSKRLPQGSQKEDDLICYGKLIKQLEEKIRKIENDSSKFYKLRDQEIKKIELWKNEEKKKLSFEQSIALKKNKGVSESVQLQNMKKEIEKLSNKIKNSEEKYNDYIENLKEIIDLLSEKNSDLLKRLQESPQEFIDTRSLQSVSEIEANNVFTAEEISNFIDRPNSPPTFSLRLPDSPRKDSAEVQKSEFSALKASEENKKEVLLSNGVRKEIFADGFVVVHFKNKDRKEIFTDGKVVYSFYESKTVQTTFPDGLVLLEFSSGQVEKHHPDGSKEIKFPDGVLKRVFTDGEEESVFPDGTFEKVEKSGVRIIEYPSGITETVLLNGNRIRRMRDGTIKKFNPAGTLIS